MVDKNEKIHYCVVFDESKATSYNPVYRIVQSNCLLRTGQGNNSYQKCSRDWLTKQIAKRREDRETIRVACFDKNTNNLDKVTVLEIKDTKEDCEEVIEKMEHRELGTGKRMKFPKSKNFTPKTITVTKKVKIKNESTVSAKKRLTKERKSQATANLEAKRKIAARIAQVAHSSEKQNDDGENMNPNEPMVVNDDDGGRNDDDVALANEKEKPKPLKIIYNRKIPQQKKTEQVTEMITTTNVTEKKIGRSILGNKSAVVRIERLPDNARIKYISAITAPADIIQTTKTAPIAETMTPPKLIVPGTQNNPTSTEKMEVGDDDDDNGPLTTDDTTGYLDSMEIADSPNELAENGHNGITAPTAMSREETNVIPISKPDRIETDKNYQMTTQLQQKQQDSSSDRRTAKTTSSKTIGKVVIETARKNDNKYKRAIRHANSTSLSESSEESLTFRSPQSTPPTSSPSPLKVNLAALNKPTSKKRCLEIENKRRINNRTETPQKKTFTTREVPDSDEEEAAMYWSDGQKELEKKPLQSCILVNRAQKKLNFDDCPAASTSKNEQTSNVVPEPCTSKGVDQTNEGKKMSRNKTSGVKRDLNSNVRNKESNKVGQKIASKLKLQDNDDSVIGVNNDYGLDESATSRNNDVIEILREILDNQSTMIDLVASDKKTPYQKLEKYTGVIDGQRIVKIGEHTMEFSRASSITTAASIRKRFNMIIDAMFTLEEQSQMFMNVAKNKEVPNATPFTELNDLIYITDFFQSILKLPTTGTMRKKNWTYPTDCRTWASTHFTEARGKWIPSRKQSRDKNHEEFMKKRKDKRLKKNITMSTKKVPAAKTKTETSCNDDGNEKNQVMYKRMIELFKPMIYKESNGHKKIDMSLMSTNTYIAAQVGIEVNRFREIVTEDAFINPVGNAFYYPVDFGYEIDQLILHLNNFQSIDSLKSVVTESDLDSWMRTTGGADPLLIPYISLKYTQEVESTDTNSNEENEQLFRFCENRIKSWLLTKVMNNVYIQKKNESASSEIRVTMKDVFERFTKLPFMANVTVEWITTKLETIRVIKKVTTHGKNEKNEITYVMNNPIKSSGQWEIILKHNLTKATAN